MKSYHHPHPAALAALSLSGLVVMISKVSTRQMPAAGSYPIYLVRFRRLLLLHPTQLSG